MTNLPERFKKFITRAGVFASALALIHFTVLWLWPSVYRFTFGFGLILFLFIFFALFHYVLLRLASQGSTAFFVRVFMLLSLVKILILLTIMAVYVAFNRDNAIPFLAVFSAGYVGFSALEVSHTYQYIRDSPSGSS